MNELPAHRLNQLGLRDIERVHTHTNRTVMVSLTAGRVLRLHRGYASAPDRVLRAIVRFLNPASREPSAAARSASFSAFRWRRMRPRPSGPRTGIGLARAT